VCGVDEVGAGPLAGPVLAAAVILDPDRIPSGLNDSKKLSPKKREQCFETILQTATIAFASVSAREIDRTDIRKARMTAMTRAVKGLAITPAHVLIDGNLIPDDLDLPSTAVIKGDSKSVSIAAASIVAKVVRDRCMARACTIYPGYGFSNHAGYGTADHLKAIVALGPTPLHRMSFRPLKDSQ